MPPMLLAARRLLPTAMIFALACSGSSGEPPTEPAKGSSEKPAEAPAPADFSPEEQEGNNFASPPTSEPGPVAGPKPSGDPDLDARIKEKHGQSCRFARACGDEMIGIDCNAAADGPYYYAKRSDLEIISTCGGACMSGECTNCPPREWTCSPDYYEE